MRRGFTIHHNGPPARCVGQPHSRCVSFWRAVCRYHGQTFGAKWATTSLYSFGVCPHGERFVGCGWLGRQAANGRDVVGANDGADSEWFTVLVFLGTDERPTDAMVDGVRRLIGEGRSSRRCGDRVLPHNAFKRKACPGPEFTAYARAWDRKGLGSTDQTPQPAPAAPSTEDDDMTAAHVELIRWHYKRSRGATYDPASDPKDPDGFAGWMLRLAGADTPAKRNAVVVACGEGIDREIAAKRSSS